MKHAHKQGSAIAAWLSIALLFSATVPASAAVVDHIIQSWSTGMYPSVQQIGQYGDTGRGGAGGAGGEGGYGGWYSFTWKGSKPGWRPQPGGPGQPGKGPTLQGGTGGAGGNGTLIIQDMGPGEAFTNFGAIVVGGNAGGPGIPGVDGSSGGAGGRGGMPWHGGSAGKEPSPDPWPASQQGGAGGAWLKNGGSGVNGGGGGGGGHAGLLGWPSFFDGEGGDGAKGLSGANGLGGSGAKGADETIVRTTSDIVSVDSTLQIGGNGGSGGQGGQGGSGGGGGGGAGGNTTVLLPNPIPFVHDPSDGGKGGGRGAGGQGGSGGAAGNGTIVVGDRGRFINEANGNIQVGRGAGVARGELQVAYGGRLFNKGAITLDNGGLTLDRGAFVENSGSIYSPTEPITAQTAVIVVNNGTITTPLFENNGFLSGSGSIAGDLANYLELAPGNSTGELAVQGNYSEYFRLVVELASLDDYGYLTVDGNVTFGNLSTLQLDFVDGFEESKLKHNDSFDFLQYRGDLFGAFGAVDYSDARLALGFWDLDYAYDLGNDLSSIRLSYNVVPIPAALPLFGSALALLAIARARRQQVRRRTYAG